MSKEMKMINAQILLIAAAIVGPLAAVMGNGELFSLFYEFACSVFYMMNATAGFLVISILAFYFRVGHAASTGKLAGDELIQRMSLFCRRLVKTTGVLYLLVITLILGVSIPKFIENADNLLSDVTSGPALFFLMLITMWFLIRAVTKQIIARSAETGKAGYYTKHMLVLAFALLATPPSVGFVLTHSAHYNKAQDDLQNMQNEFRGMMNKIDAPAQHTQP